AAPGPITGYLPGMGGADAGCGRAHRVRPWAERTARHGRSVCGGSRRARAALRRGLRTGGAGADGTLLHRLAAIAVTGRLRGAGAGGAGRLPTAQAPRGV